MLTCRKHTMKDTESRARTTTANRKADETDGKRASISAHRQDRSPPGSAGLPRAASWANKGLHNSTTHTNASASYSTHSLTSTARSTRRTTPSTRTQRSGSTTNESKATTRDRKPPLSSTLPPKPPSLPSSSRPATPASASNRPLTPGNAKSRPKESIAAPLSRSPPPESEVGSASQGVSPPFSPEAVIVTKEPPTNAPTVPPGVPAVPPGLTPPPGLPHPSRLPSSSTSSPQVSVQPSQSSYQMSTQAQALVEDIRARRESSTVTINQSPFPDFDRMLQALSGGDNGFSFTLDPKLAVSEHDATLTLPELEAETASTPYTGSFLDIFPGVLQSAQSSPALGYMAPPGLSIPQSRASFDPGSSRSPISDRGSSASGYTGSFNPFASEASEDPPRRYSPLDEERKVSRFGFARGRQGSSSSPLHAPSPLGYGDNMSHTSFFSAPEATSPVNHAQPQWNYANRPHQFDYTQQPSSVMSSPLAQHSKAQSPYALQQQAQPSRFQPFDNGVSEAQLRDLISSSRDRLNTSRNGPTGRTLMSV